MRERRSSLREAEAGGRRGVWIVVAEEERVGVEAGGWAGVCMVSTLPRSAVISYVCDVCPSVLVCGTRVRSVRVRLRQLALQRRQASIGGCFLG